MAFSSSSFDVCIQPGRINPNDPVTLMFLIICCLSFVSSLKAVGFNNGIQQSALTMIVVSKGLSLRSADIY